MKIIKYTILFLSFVISLYYSQSVTILASSIWTLLYGNSELYSFYFILITLIYLLFIYSYFNLLNINRKLIKFLFNKLSFYNLFLLILNIIYDFYYYLFKLIQPLLISYMSKVSKSKIIFNDSKKYYLGSFLYYLSRSVPFFKNPCSEVLFGINFQLKYELSDFLKKQSDRQLIASLIKKAYMSPIYIHCNGKTYQLTLHETLVLLDRINFKFRSNNPKLFNNLIKLIKFVDNYQYVYDELLDLNELKYPGYNDMFFQYGPNEPRFFSKKEIRKLVVDQVKYFTSKPAKLLRKLLRIINNNHRNYRLFVLICFHKYLSKINSFMTKNKLVISIDPKLLAKSYVQFYKIEYNLFYLSQKEAEKEMNLNKLYFKFFISEFFREIKVMFKFIKYFIFFYFLMFIINPIFVSYFIFIILVSSLIIQYFREKNYEQSRLFKSKIYRLIYYKICYSFNLLILTNSLYLILLNYLILTLILILIFSLKRTLTYPFMETSDTPFFFILKFFRQLVNHSHLYQYYYAPLYRYYWRNRNPFKYRIITFFFKEIMNYQLLMTKIIKFLNKN